jgi:cysteine desulfurase
MSEIIYLDNHATTPCDPRVVETMLPYFTQYFGNSSSPHLFGNTAAEAVKNARTFVASLIAANDEEIIFTSGATESNNLAILGTINQFVKLGGHPQRIVTTSIEHKSVFEPYQHLAKSGWDVIILPVDKYGVIKLEAAEKAINEETLLVSVQLANSEIGTIQPVNEVVKLARKYGALVHSDASQAVGKIPIDVGALGVDLLSFSGHKMYGPKGIGALWVKGGVKQLPISPLFTGGNQEWGLRPGTLPVPLIVGFGIACKLCQENQIEESKKICLLRDSLESQLLTIIENLQINGSKENRLPNNSNITFFNIDAEALLANLPNLAISTGSACESGSLEPSKVLLSIGLSYEDAFCTLRFGLGRFTTQNEVNLAVTSIVDAHQQIETLLKEKITQV